jgi:hypothetical protein
MTGFSICSSIGSNTGAIDCDPSRGLPVQIIAGSASFSPTDYATAASFQTAFLNKLKEPAGSVDKLFPFPVIQANTDKTTAAKFATLGYGLQLKLLRSKPGYEFDVLCGSSLEKKLIAFDGLIMPVLVLDDKSKMWGVLDKNQNFKGAKYLVSVEPKGFEDGNAAKTTKITIAIIDSRDFTENAEFAGTSFNASDIVGLNDVIPYQALAATTNVYHIGLKIPTSNILSFLNVAGTYTSALAVTNLWKAGTGANFATPLTITSVAYDAANLCWTVTFDSTTFTALASGTPIEVGLTDSLSLDTAGITGIEGTLLIITKP